MSDDDVLNRVKNKVEMLTDYHIEDVDKTISEITDDPSELFTEKEAKALLYMLDDTEECDVDMDEMEALFSNASFAEIEDLFED